MEYGQMCITLLKKELGQHLEMGQMELKEYFLAFSYLLTLDFQEQQMQKNEHIKNNTQESSALNLKATQKNNQVLYSVHG